MNTIAKIFQWLLGLSIALAVFNLIVMAADVESVSKQLLTTLWQLAGLGFVVGVIGNIVIISMEKE